MFVKTQRKEGDQKTTVPGPLIFLALKKCIIFRLCTTDANIVVSLTEAFTRFLGELLSDRFSFSLFPVLVVKEKGAGTFSKQQTHRVCNNFSFHCKLPMPTPRLA